MFRRFKSSGRRFGSSRFRGRPVARKQRIWIQTSAQQAESNAVVTSLPFFQYADWPVPSGAFMQTLTVKRVLLLLGATQDDTQVERTYGVYQDDATDAVQSSGFVWDPSSATAANVRIPQKVFRWGALIVPPSVTAGATGSGQVSPGFYTNRDGVRDIKLSTRLRQDEVLTMSVSPGATGNLVTWTLRARILVELG